MHSTTTKKAEEKRRREQKVVLALTTGMCELYFRLWREQKKASTGGTFMAES